MIKLFWNTHNQIKPTSQNPKKEDFHNHKWCLYHKNFSDKWIYFLLNKIQFKLIENERDLDGFKNESKTLLQGFSTIGRSHFLNGALLNAEPGDILGPLETNRGQAIVQLLEIEDFDSTKFENQKVQLRDLIFSRKQGQLFQAWIDELKKDSDIIDNRKYYF